MRTSLVVVTAAILCLVGCRTGGEDSSSSSSSAGGAGTDGGIPGRRDAGPRVDAGMTTTDAGSPVDAGTPDARVVTPVTERETLRWRTGVAFEAHVAQALSLTEDEVCAEVGRFKCVTRPASERPFRPSGTTGSPTFGLPIPHLVALGGNEPFDLQMYEPRRGPGATTPNAVDRVVLAACDARVEKDRAGPAVVFTGVNLAGASITDAAAFRQAAAGLFRRFHLRDATAAELDLVVTLAQAGGDGVVPTAADAALAVCVAIGGMSETAFD